MSDTNMDVRQMDAEIAALILKTPESPTYPSRELQVSNAFIKEHPEYEKSRTEVYVAYVRVIQQMKKDGKLSASGAAPTSILVRPAPSSKATQDSKPKGEPQKAKPKSTPQPQPKSPAQEIKPKVAPQEAKPKTESAPPKEKQNGVILREFFKERIILREKNTEQILRLLGGKNMESIKKALKKLLEQPHGEEMLEKLQKITPRVLQKE